MGLNNTPTAERIHIGFFGMRNAGKSSLVNAVTNQDLSVVSDVKGTTTDAVSKSMELLPLGPVVIIDTPGFDDEGILGNLRIERTKKVLNTVDIAVLVVNSESGLTELDNELLKIIKDKSIPYIIAYNKCDLKNDLNFDDEYSISVSAAQKINIELLKEKIACLLPKANEQKVILGDIIKPLDLVILVTPIDEAAPKGRLILPQQQVLRDILDHNGIAIVVKDTELKETLNKLEIKPKLVVTDSQVFKYVSDIVPRDVPLTSFSILMARHKGILFDAVSGVKAIDNLKDGDTVLIAEACTHHRQCNDIGTVKIPNWIKKHTNKNINIKSVSGKDFPEDLSEFKLIFQCGGCMITEREVNYRIKCAKDQNVPITNYGTAIAYMNGILKRSIEMFDELPEL